MMILAAAASAPAAAPQDNPAMKPAPKLLVMKNGHVIHGTIRVEKYGYRVDTPRSRLFFDYDHVKFDATDIHDAYKKMAASISDRSVRRDLILGRWCLENSLQAEAANHLRAALKFEVTSEEAKQLLARLEASVEENGAAGNEPAGEPSRDNQRPESLARLSPSAVREYVTGIQPVLVSRCGGMQCHGAKATSFHLELVHLGERSNRAATARNLDVVLSQIDSRFPTRSRLLERASQPHGDLVRAPLDGRAGPEQTQRLRRWIQAVAPELNRLEHQDESRAVIDRVVQSRRKPPIQDGNVVPAGASQDASGPVPVRSPSGSMGFRQSPSSPQQRPADRQTNGGLGPLTDPFDPARFNNRN